jgi:hypothetical protein
MRVERLPAFWANAATPWTSGSAGIAIFNQAPKPNKVEACLEFLVREQHQ